MSIIAVAGTGTDVGKTYVGNALLAALRARGIAVAARKPVQSFTVGDETTDAHVLAAATGEDPNVVCPPHRWLPLALAPPIAADALGLPPFTIAELTAEVRAGARAETFTLVETAGGVRSPIADDGDCAAFVTTLDPDIVVLVADAGLGTINVVRMSVDVLRAETRNIVVYLNRYDDTDEVHTTNGHWLRTREGLDVVTDIETLANHVTA